MRKNHLIVIFYCFFLTASVGQEKQKDTLFFSYDENYILFQDDYQKWFDVSYAEFEREILKNMHKTQTDGYFFFKKKDTLFDLLPQKILSLKDYVENRDFYYLGKYNRIIDREKLKDKIFNKYKVFVVKNNLSIEIRQHKYENFYNYYYPIKYQDQENFPKQVKDTLFFKYDNNYISTYKLRPNTYFLVDNTGSTDSAFFFEELEIIDSIATREILSLKKVVRSSRFYNKKRKSKLNGERLAYYFSNYVIFLIKEIKNGYKYIKVEAGWEIE
jgi:hypothetical protein